MATTTANLKLTKPAAGEKANITLINNNMDVIDSKVGPFPSNGVSGITDLYSLIMDARPGPKRGTGTTFSEAAAAITSTTVSSTENFGEVANAIDAIVQNDSLAPKNSISTHMITNTTITGFAILFKRASAYYYGGIFIPISSSTVPLVFARYAVRYYDLVNKITQENRNNYLPVLSHGSK